MFLTRAVQKCTARFIGGIMECRDALLMIRPFINNTLSPADTRRLIKHVKCCSDCYDELEVSFLVDKACGSLSAKQSASEDFNFSDALNKEIGTRERKLKGRSIKILFLLLFALTVLGFLLYRLFLYFGVL